MKLFLAYILALLALSLPACLAPAGGGLPFVGFATLTGDGDVRTDGTLYLAIGELQGDAGIFAKGSGFPLTFPLDLKKDEWVLANKSTGTTVRGNLKTAFLPVECASLYRPGEAQTVASRLGVTSLFATPLP
jgi:hypothetical protein